MFKCELKLALASTVNKIGAHHWLVTLFGTARFKTILIRVPIIFLDFQGELNILNEVLFAIILNVKTKGICDTQSVKVHLVHCEL